jgi:colicin import membrane protein
MRPAEVHDHEIVRAGIELQGEGREVTGFRLRQRLGGGNAQRLKTVWDEHVIGQLSVEIAPDLPIDVADRLSAMTVELTAQMRELAIRLNASAVRAAELRTAEVVRGASEQRRLAEQEVGEASAEVERLEVALRREQESVGRTTAQLSALSLELATSRERLTMLDASAATTAQELGRLREQVESMAAELALARSEASTRAGQLNEARSVNDALIAKLGPAEKVVV